MWDQAIEAGGGSLRNLQFKATLLLKTRMRVVDSLVFSILLRFVHSFLDLQWGERWEALTTCSKLFTQIATDVGLSPTWFQFFLASFRC